jgi:Phosphodiester glycosidase
MRSDAQVIDIAGFADHVQATLAFQSDFYARFSFRLPHSRARGHILRIPRIKPLALRVAVDPRALWFDFSKYSTRPDLPGRTYSGRPGIYLSYLVRDIASATGFCLGLNGNNLGYWPNQFAVADGRLVFKPVPGLYENELEDVSGPAHFLSQAGDGGFDIRTIDVVGAVAGSERKVTLQGDASFSAGVSGYPLFIRSRAVWNESRRAAWDPKLIADVPSAHQRTRSELVKRVCDVPADQAWLRHAFTLAGTTSQHELVLVAVEERESNDGGISLPAAADLMSCLGCTDAIVLGGKGDVQAVSSQEGAIVRPLLSPHDRAVSRQVHAFGMHVESDLANHERLVLERPIPCALVLCTESPR